MIEDRPSRHRVRQAAILRLGIVVLCLAVLRIQESLLPAAELRYAAAYALLGIAAFLASALLAPVVRLVPARALALSLHVLDAALITGLVYLTGGVNSTFTYLYFALIFGAGMTFAPMASLVAASGSSILLAGVWYLYQLARTSGLALPLVAPTWVEILGADPQLGMGYLFAQIAAFHLVGLLSSLLVVRLSRARVLTQEILLGSPAGVLALEADGRIAFVNQPARDLLGIRYDEPVVGRPAAEVLATASARKVLDPLAELKEMSFETDLVNLQREAVPVEVTTRVLRGSGRRPRGAIAILADLSMKKRMEDAEKRADRLEALGRMAAAIAHEIRNPLAAIRGSAQELAGLSGLSEVDGRLLSLVVSESDRLERILSEFLKFARMRKPSFVSCDVGRTLRDVALLLSRHAGDVGRIAVEILGPMECRGDPEQLTQVFYNLGKNAIEASPPDERVTIRAYPQDHLRSVSFDPASGEERREEVWGVTVDFIDRGPGLDAKTRGRLFEPFFTTKENGTGLGLAVAHRIVEGHKGSVLVLRDPEEGTIFRVWLPRVPEYLPGEPGAPT